MTHGSPLRIKICGITSLDDALAAAGSGADALGFVFYGKSPRYVDPEKAGEIIGRLPPLVTTVGVFVDEPADRVNEIIKTARLDAAQLHGDETPEECLRVEARVIKALRVRGPEVIERMAGYDVAAFLLDAFREDAPGGTGETFDWAIAARAAGRGRVILSGGLTPDNVAGAARKVRPYGVDVSSGVELAPGRKDHERVRRFIEEARAAL
ncbi:MAG: phosphoribosylanthranilate isomerase [Thermodesulfobacteriota bacterium]